MSDFQLLPPRLSARTPASLIVSLVVHALLILPYALHHATAPERHDPIDQMVVFLVPPDKPGGREAQTKGSDWISPAGNQGVTKEEIRTPEPAEKKLEVGELGEADSIPRPPVPEPDAEVALTELEVDSAVVRDPSSAAPVYPETLLRKRIEGATFVHYVVDTTGLVDAATIQVVRTTHPEFANAVRTALFHMKFRPAIQSSRKVRQWVEQNFAFKIAPRSVPADTT